MERIKSLFEHSGMSLEDFGKRMGRPPGTARRAAWQFLNSTSDPRLSMVEKAAVALGVDVAELIKRQPPRDEIRRSIAAIYAEASRVVAKSDSFSLNNVMLGIAKETENVLASYTADVRHEWDTWRTDTGHGLYGLRHAGKIATSADFSAALLKVATALSEQEQVD